MTDQAQSALDLASTPVVSVSPELGAMEALHEMYRRDVHHLAVVAEDGALGVVSTTDLLQGIAAQYPKTITSVGSLCPAPGLRVDAADDIDVAARRMIDAHADAVLVMRQGQVCGVLTAVDFVRTFVSGRPEEEGS